MRVNRNYVLAEYVLNENDCISLQLVSYVFSGVFYFSSYFISVHIIACHFAPSRFCMYAL